MCEILKFNLRNASYEVDVANSAEEAFSKLKNSYDLILLDVLMVGITGLNLPKLIRAEYGITIPIIFINFQRSEK